MHFHSWRARAATWALAGAGALTLAPGSASAFLLVGKSPKVAGDQLTVVVVREGKDTVLSIQARARGPGGEVALLVPVTATVGEARTLAASALDAVGRVTGPRVVEYWEQDPCGLPDLPSTTDGTFEAPAETPRPAAPTGDLTTEVSSAKTGAELVGSLKKDGFAVPDRAEALLDGYLKAGMKIVVARIDAAKLPRDGDTATLPPLRLHTRADDLTLPTRLFALGAAPASRREISLYVVAPGVRFEAAGQPNLAVPTNLDVTFAVRGARGPFYRALLDRVFDKSPGALLTEYAWRASSCELCAAPLSGAELDGLGDENLPSSTSGKRHEVIVDAAAVAARPDGPEEVRTALHACYGQALATKKDLAGEVSLTLEVGADGSLQSFSTQGSPNDALARCASEAVRASHQWKAGSKGTVTVKFAPLSRAYLSGLVLTGLRARYDAVPERDLTLVPGRAIEGGREMGTEGAAEKRVYAAPAGNDFHARYVIRHPFAGPVKCESPQRGVWGGPPKDGAPHASSDAGAPGADGGSPRLESWIQGDLPDLNAFAIKLGPPVAAPEPAPSPPGAPSAAAPAPSASAPPASQPPAASSGCGSCATGAGSEPPAWAPLLALSALALSRRPRRRPRRP